MTAVITHVSVDNEIEDALLDSQDKRCQQRATFAFIFILTAIVLFVGLEIAANSAPDDKNSQDLVLPDATISLAEVSDERTSGSITFSPYEMVFDFKSLYNKTYDSLTFMWASDTLAANEMDAEDYYDTYLHGISGFGVHLEGEDVSTSPASNSSLEISFCVYEFGSSEPTITTFQSDAEGNLVPDENLNLLTSLMTGYVGQYFVELSIKLGSLGYSGSDYTSVRFIHTHAKFIYTNALQNGTMNWNLTVLQSAIEQTNDIVQGASDTSDTSDTSDDGGQEDELTQASRRLMGYPETCPSPSTYSYCGNDCFGMCGHDCDCWVWFCGTCNCVNDCHWHDHYCSCDSFWGFWCVNTFWISC